MGLPSHRHSSSRRDKRRSHHALKPGGILSCSKCKSPILPHQACRACGYYNGRMAIAIKTKKVKKEKK